MSNLKFKGQLFAYVPKKYKFVVMEMNTRNYFLKKYLEYTSVLPTSYGFSYQLNPFFIKNNKAFII